MKTLNTTNVYVVKNLRSKSRKKKVNMYPKIEMYPIIDMYPKGPIMKKPTIGKPIFVVGTESFSLIAQAESTFHRQCVEGRLTSVSGNLYSSLRPA